MYRLLLLANKMSSGISQGEGVAYGICRSEEPHVWCPPRAFEIVKADTFLVKASAFIQTNASSVRK
jgi:hypothetical protein